MFDVNELVNDSKNNLKSVKTYEELLKSVKNSSFFV